MSFKNLIFYLFFFISLVGLDTKLKAQVKVLQFGKIIDGKGGIIQNGIILIKNDKIVKIGKEGEFAIPKEAATLDLKRFTAIPGMIDVHTHMTYYWDKTPGTRPWAQLGTLGPAVTVYLAQENARKALECGITSVRDLGSQDNMDFSMRDLIERGQMIGPRMFVAGYGLHISSAPYKLGSIPDPGQADGISEVQRVARQQIAAGADWVKVYGSTGSDKDVTGYKTYTYEEMKAAVDVAHQAGKRIAIHSYGPDGARDAVRAGTNSVEHAIHIDPATFKSMVSQGIYYVPTVDHNLYYVRHRLEYGYTEADSIALMGYLQENFETLKDAVKAGVKIAMGSDAVFTGFGENTQELAWFVKAGLSPEKALNTANLSAAELLGMEKQLGAISPGYYADIVALDGDPLKNIEVAIKKVVWVMKGGKIMVDKTSK